MTGRTGTKGQESRGELWSSSSIRAPPGPPQASARMRGWITLAWSWTPPSSSWRSSRPSLDRLWRKADGWPGWSVLCRSSLSKLNDKYARSRVLTNGSVAQGQKSGSWRRPVVPVVGSNPALPFYALRRLLHLQAKGTPGIRACDGDAGHGP